jgi:hypothetical protein
MARKPRQKPLTLAQRRANPACGRSCRCRSSRPPSRRSASATSRSRAENKNPLYDPTTQLAGHSLVQAAQDLADTSDQAEGRRATTGSSRARRRRAPRSRPGRRLLQAARAGGDAGKVASAEGAGGMLNQQTARWASRRRQAFAGWAQAEQQRQAQDAALRGQGLGGDTTTGPAEIRRSRAPPRRCSRPPANQAAQTGSDWASLANAMARPGSCGAARCRASC